MIYWFTGQPGAGKTILSEKLSYWLNVNHHSLPFIIDGDDMRELFSNKDYSIKGRVENVGTAQRIAHYLHNQDKDVIVALVSPYIDQREDFKTLLGSNIKEIYVYTSETRERDHFKAISYISPTDNYIDIDTTYDTPSQSLDKIIKQI
jgi:adenylylsulfate kinase|tara:strand:+ start:7725 stop:8168 length:444 start_codon:yes stop_codon:yes gene_type:complete